MNCSSRFIAVHCLHVCEGEAGHDEEHECECGQTWDDEEQEDD